MANAEKLIRAWRWAELHPEQHNQLHWAEKTSCGTAMCLAGTGVFLGGYPFRWYGSLSSECTVPDTHPLFQERVRNAAYGSVYTAALARHEFEIDLDQADELFLPGNTLTRLAQLIAKFCEMELDEFYQRAHALTDVQPVVVSA
jgi:hypothetical protein